MTDSVETGGVDNDFMASLERGDHLRHNGASDEEISRIKRITDKYPFSWEKRNCLRAEPVEKKQIAIYRKDTGCFLSSKYLFTGAASWSPSVNKARLFDPEDTMFIQLAYSHTVNLIRDSKAGVVIVEVTYSGKIVIEELGPKNEHETPNS